MRSGLRGGPVRVLETARDSRVAPFDLAARPQGLEDLEAVSLDISADGRTLSFTDGQARWLRLPLARCRAIAELPPRRNAGEVAYGRSGAVLTFMGTPGQSG